MKKVFSILTMFAVALVTGVFSADRAEAVPAFARQMQMSCKACHFQHFPKLNAFGRAFKVNGYTDVAVDTINGDWHSSLPVNLNASWITKMRYQKSVSQNDCTGTCGGTARGELQFVDEGTFFIGGRIAEHVGAAVEVADGVPWGNGTIVFGHDLESLHTHVGLALWSADAAGPYWGKEIFNTGLIRGSRGFENRDETQAAGIIYRTQASWSGLTAYANHEWFFAALSAATIGQHGVDVGADMSGIYRVALTPPQVLGFDWMIGTYGAFGSTSTTGGDNKPDVTTQWVGLDFQAQGNVTEGITLEVNANFLLDTDDPSTRNMLDEGQGEDFKRYQFAFDLGFLNDRLITKFNYLHSAARRSGSSPGDANWQRESVDVVTLGLYYNIRENVSLRPEISWTVGSSTHPTEANAGMVRNRINNDTIATIMLWYAF